VAIRLSGVVNLGLIVKILVRHIFCRGWAS
jgi:hypothetical protein